MKARKKLNVKRARRAARVSATVRGTAEMPRLVVNRTNQYVYAQLIDDVKGNTLAAISSFGKGASGVGATGSGAAASGKAGAGKKSDQAFAAGELLAKMALAKGISAVVFDRREARFHGRVKSFADGAKKGGLTI